MERALVAQQVANKLFATENSIDQAIADASLLVGELLKARKELGASAVFGDEAFARTTAALAALGQARSAVVAAHNELSEAKLRAGIRTKLAGIGDKLAPHGSQHVETSLRETG